MKKFLKKLVVPIVLCCPLLFSTNIYAAKNVEFLNVYSNGVDFKLEKDKDVKNINGSSYIKADKLFEILNTYGTYSFEQKNDIVNYKNGNRSFSMKVGAKEAKINESPSIAPEIKKIDNEIYVPLRFVSGKLGNSVIWNNDANVIGIADKKNTKEIVSMMQNFSNEFIKNPKLYMEFDTSTSIITEHAEDQESFSISMGSKSDFLIDLNKNLLFENITSTESSTTLSSDSEKNKYEKYEIYDDGTNSYHISDGNILTNESLISQISSYELGQLVNYKDNIKAFSNYDEFMPFMKTSKKDGLIKIEGTCYINSDTVMKQYPQTFLHTALTDLVEDTNYKLSEPIHLSMLFNQTTGQLLSYESKFALKFKEDDFVGTLKYNFKVPTIIVNPDMEVKVPDEIKNAVKSSEESFDTDDSTDFCGDM